MKILIIGEYSGVGLNLCKGFKELGAKCEVISYGDGRKRIKDSLCKTYNIGSQENRKILRYINIVMSGLRFFFFQKKKGFDVVFIMNECFIKEKYSILKPYMTMNLIKKSKKVILLACGDNYIYQKHFDEMKKNCHLKVNDQILDRYKIEYERVINDIDGIIPFSYDYYLGFFNESEYTKKKLLPPSFFPLKIEKNIEILNNYDPIIILHGYRKNTAKGSEIIEQALLELEKKYKGIIKVIISKDLIPYNEWMKMIEASTIVVDQCNSYGSGMNALIALSMGKIVLSGNEIENQQYMYGVKSPIINIQNSVENIIDKIENLIINRNMLNDIRKQGIKYINEYHDCNIVAKTIIKNIYEHNK